VGVAVTAPLYLSFASGATIEPSARPGLLGNKGASLVRMTELGLPFRPASRSPPALLATPETMGGPMRSTPPSPTGSPRWNTTPAAASAPARRRCC
jgi:hypothetical protein